MIFRKIALGTLVSTSLIVCPITAANSSTEITFEAATCKITLDDSYSADVNGHLQVTIPDTALDCPFPTGPSTTALDVNFSEEIYNPNVSLGAKYNDKYDASTNSIIRTWSYELLGDNFSSSPITYSKINDSANYLVSGNFYLVNDSKYYRLVLTKPFTVSRKNQETQPCTIKLAKSYGYSWQNNKPEIIPDSAVKCEGFTFNSTDYELRLSLETANRVYTTVAVASDLTYEESSKSYKTSNYLVMTGTYYGWWWGGDSAINGAFKQSNHDVSYVKKRNQPTSTAPVINKLTFTGSVYFKRNTDISVKVKRTSGSSLQLKITADRNTSYQNGTRPTPKRQTVIPSAKEDLAIIKRGSTVIRKVRLSIYGKATVSIPDIAGKNKYTVTMVATDNNNEGKATFTK